jgi:hypothetical protein
MIPRGVAGAYLFADLARPGAVPSISYMNLQLIPLCDPPADGPTPPIDGLQTLILASEVFGRIGMRGDT